jgi:hypothetical protein
MATKHVFTVEIVFNAGTPPTFGTSYVTDLLLSRIEEDNLIELEADRISIQHSSGDCDPIESDGWDEEDWL